MMCARELPELELIRAEFEPRGVQFVALSLERDADLVREAAKTLGIRMRVAFTKSEVLAPLGVNGVPSTVFVRADGTIVAAASGERTGKFLRERTRELLR
ncbi:MAG TPA: TlpA disulfide reductase family protein [Myxococcaceae bacterium]|nr:TlpA disulfide reductase family protein [Myxococcaceae bacterium]